MTTANQASEVKRNSLNNSNIDVKLESIIRSCIDDPHDRTIGEAKQAITSLIKELVEEARISTLEDVYDDDRPLKTSLDHTATHEDLIVCDMRSSFEQSNTRFYRSQSHLCNS